jgi:hypothetical protein
MKPNPLLIWALLLPLVLSATQSVSAERSRTLILTPRDASRVEHLAAREVRRYVYLRTGQLLSLTIDSPEARERGNSIAVARGSWAGYSAIAGATLAGELRSLQPQQFRIVHCDGPNGGRVLIAGGDESGTLYGAYRFAEYLGARFYLHGDVLPDELQPWSLPNINEQGKPLFPLRGIQPFHDFPEGPDWWNRDDYLAILGQLPKLGMNFFGLHTYPENRPNAEPTVWIGLPEDAGTKGRVKSSYPSSYQNTIRGNWGYTALKTSDFIGGAAGLFERDDFGPEVMFGLMPAPTTPEACNAMFDRTAAMLRDAFTFAHLLGIKTCVGTETPLVIPAAVKARQDASGRKANNIEKVRELYAGIFQRAKDAYPLDYYWLWTPEGWTWSGTKLEDIIATTNDIYAAIWAHKAVNPPFALATCGWVLGPQQDRALFDKALPRNIAVSCINREVGYAPVDPAFAKFEGRSKWAIPWMEDDPALSAPQFWVGRMRRDAADALRYGCDGLMGIHWRTRALAMNVAALARAAWTQEPWIRGYKGPVAPPELPRTSGPVGGQVAAFPNNAIADTDDDPLYQTVRYNVSAYRVPASNGVCRVKLKFCEPHYNEAGRRVFDVQVQNSTVLTDLDIFARAGKDRALDYTFNDVLVTNGWLDITFLPKVEFPSIAAISVEGPAFTWRINCGGPPYNDYQADAAPAAVPPAPVAPCSDFYVDWATHEFGPDAGPAAAAIFTRIDGSVPKPATWVDGPGGIQPDSRPWSEVKPAYAFADEFAALASRVRGAGNRDRFDYWLSTLEYFRLMGQVNCAWGEYNRVIENVRKEKDAAAQKRVAIETALPARKRLVALVNELQWRLLATVTNPGELGTVANWNQHNLPSLLVKPGQELGKVLGESLPADAQPSREYRGPTRVFLPTIRTTMASDEPLRLKMLVLSQEPVKTATLHWRKLGSKRFNQQRFTAIGRGVYSVELPAPGANDFEYYATAETLKGRTVWPASAPQLNQTVVTW